jgi:hypothetical protein
VVLLGHLQQALRRGRFRTAGNARWSAERLRSACSNQGEGKLEMLSRRERVVV